MEHRREGTRDVDREKVEIKRWRESEREEVDR